MQSPLLLIGIVGFSTTLQASILLNQTFDIPDTTNPFSQGVVGEGGFSWYYKDAPEFDWQVSSGTLTVTHTELSGPTSLALVGFSAPVLIVQMQLAFTGPGTTQVDSRRGVSMFVGDNFPNTPVSSLPDTEPGGGTYGSTFGYVNFNTLATANDGWGFVRGNNESDDPATTPSAYYTGTQTITWILNNSGDTYTYSAPGGSSASVDQGSWDLWVGSDLHLDNALANTSFTQDMSINSFWFRWHGSEAIGATLTLDNVSISAVPEPAHTVLVAALVAFLYGCQRSTSLKPSSRT